MSNTRIYRLSQSADYFRYEICIQWNVNINWCWFSIWNQKYFHQTVASPLIHLMKLVHRCSGAPVIVICRVICCLHCIGYHPLCTGQSNACRHTFLGYFVTWVTYLYWLQFMKWLPLWWLSRALNSFLIGRNRTETCCYRWGSFSKPHIKACFGHNRMVHLWSRDACAAIHQMWWNRESSATLHLVLKSWTCFTFWKPLMCSAGGERCVSVWLAVLCCGVFWHLISLNNSHDYTFTIHLPHKTISQYFNNSWKKYSWWHENWKHTEIYFWFQTHRTCWALLACLYSALCFWLR